jgi:rod shape-determining protein MreB
LHRGRELAIDLGTANTLVFVRGGGIAVFEPSVVAIDERQAAFSGRRGRAQDDRADAGDDPGDPAAPHGVIADFDVTAEMLRYFIRRDRRRRPSFSRVVLCVRADHDVERTPSRRRRSPRARARCR